MVKFYSRRALQLLLLVGLPILLVGGFLLWNTSSQLNEISRAVDAQEHTRAGEAVQSAFTAQLHHLDGLMADSANWDDAVSHSYGEPDVTWMQNTWGISTSDEGNYDLAYVVSRDGHTIAGFRNGEAFKTDADQFFGPVLKQISAELPDDNSSYASISSLVDTPDGIMAISVGTIVPTTETLNVPADKSSMLIFGQRVTEQVLSKMSREFIVDRLRLLPLSDPAPGALLLRDNWKTPVVKATWDDRHPGWTARASYAREAAGLILGLLGVLIPISAVHFSTLVKLEESHRRAQHRALHDSLTGLPNRHQLSDQIALGLASPGLDVALLYLDLDGFKTVNDTFDHETGDRLLQAVASGLNTLTRGKAVLARLGGDEFAVLLRGSTARHDAERLAGEIVEFVKTPFDLDGRIITVGASIGIVTVGRDVTDANELMRRADIAMYNAKESGRSQWRWYDAAFDRGRTEELKIAAEMRQFIANGEFEVAYQPIVDAATRSILAVEALARWPRASARQLRPDQFIAIAEEHGLIGALSRQIVTKACRDVWQWRDLRLAINISPLQFSDPQIAAELLATVRGSGFDPARLDVEFTEQVLIRNQARARAVVAELRAAGVRVALDDFGTGFASVGYLREFQFDCIKIDRSLTQAVLRDAAAQKVVQGTIAIAEGLSAHVLAEGVETDEEARIMYLCGCRQLQGYFFGGPQSAGQIETSLSRPAVTSVA